MRGNIPSHWAAYDKWKEAGVVVVDLIENKEETGSRAGGIKHTIVVKYGLNIEHLQV